MKQGKKSVRATHANKSQVWDRSLSDGSEFPPLRATSQKAVEAATKIEVDEAIADGMLAKGTTFTVTLADDQKQLADTIVEDAKEFASARTEAGFGT